MFLDELHEKACNCMSLLSTACPVELVVPRVEGSCGQRAQEEGVPLPRSQGNPHPSTLGASSPWSPLCTALVTDRKF